MEGKTEETGQKKNYCMTDEWKKAVEYRAIRIGIKEDGENFYSENTCLRFSKFLGINHYLEIYTMGSVTKEAEPKEKLGERINMLRRNLELSRPKYVAVTFYKASPGFKEKVMAGLEDRLEIPEGWDDFRTRIWLPIPKGVEDIIVRRYVPEA
jgi:hypothetical protein